MTNEHHGPLSYDVPEELQDVSAQRPILIGGAVAIGLALITTGIGWWALGVLSSQKIVIWGAALVIVGGAVSVALLQTVTGLRRRRRNAILGAGAVALFCAFISTQVLDLARPTLPQIVAAADEFRPPSGLVKVAGGEVRSGSRRCDPAPPTVTRLYRAPEPLTDAVSLTMAAFYDQGWAPQLTNVPKEAQTIAVKGRFLADVYMTGSDREVRIVFSGKLGCGGAYTGG